MESRTRLYGDEDGMGWLPRGFLTYFAGPPAGRHAQMTEALIESVHAFSQYVLQRGGRDGGMAVVRRLLTQWGGSPHAALPP